MNDIVFMVLRCIVAVCAALISAYAVPYIRRLSQKEQYAGIVEMIQTAVQAAEQCIKESGTRKKEWVMEYAADWLTDHGITISNEQLDALIESAVYALNWEG